MTETPYFLPYQSVYNVVNVKEQRCNLIEKTHIKGKRLVTSSQIVNKSVLCQVCYQRSEKVCYADIHWAFTRNEPLKLGKQKVNCNWPPTGREIKYSLFPNNCLHSFGLLLLLFKRKSKRIRYTGRFHQRSLKILKLREKYVFCSKGNKWVVQRVVRCPWVCTYHTNKFI